MIAFNHISISKKLMIGFLVIIFVAVASSVAIYVLLQKLKKIDYMLSDVQTTFTLKFKDLHYLHAEASKLANSWIYQSVKKDKDRLQVLIDKELQNARLDISMIETNQLSDSVQYYFTDYLNSSNVLLAGIKEITSTLHSDEAYADDAAVDKAIASLDENVSVSMNRMQVDFDGLVHILEKDKEQLQTQKSSSYNIMTISMLLVMLTVIFVGVGATYLSNQSISKPINTLQIAVDKASKGTFVQLQETSRADEVGMITNALVRLMRNLELKTVFASNIGKGNYDQELELSSEDDMLGNALVHMRDSLKLAQIEDRKRDWVNTGIAKISEVLRTHTTQPELLYDQVLQFIVKYLNANQGALFEVEGEGEDSYLELKACYAYSRKKHLHKRVEIGEGLVGQACIEKDKIYLTDIPEDYIQITSGTGGALPKAVLIFPLIVNEKIYGVIEIASFTELEAYQIDFALKIGESIASTLSSAKVNDITRKLLAEAKLREEELKSQEEEMRQNMEELQATQEQMRRQEYETVERLRKEFELKEAQYKRKLELAGISEDVLIT